MGDLSRIDRAQQIEVTDGVDTTADVLTSDPGGSAPGLVVREAGTPSVQGDVASDSADSGNPIKIGGLARTTDPTAVAAGDRVNAILDILGKLIVLPYSTPDELVSGKVELLNTTATAVIAAGGAGIRTYITSITIVNNSTTSTVLVAIQDGATDKFVMAAAELGAGCCLSLPTPIRCSANTAVNAQVKDPAGWTETTPDGIHVTLTGYQAAN